MSAQSTYDLNTAKGYAGMLVGQNPREVVTGLVEDVDGINFGVVVSRGSDLERQITKGGVDGSLFLGITVRSLEVEGEANTGAIKRNQYEAAPVLRTGVVLVEVPSGCAVGDAVKFAESTGIIDSGAPGVGELALANAEFISVAAAGELAELRIGL